VPNLPVAVDARGRSACSIAIVRLDYTFIHWAIQWRRRLIVLIDLLTI
jgi:hypothetical protein